MSGLVSFIFSLWEHARRQKIEAWAFFAVGCLCLIIAFDQAWQDEHRNSQILMAEKSAAIEGKNFWESQSYEKDSSLRTRDELLTKNYGVLAQTQSSFSQLSANWLTQFGKLSQVQPEHIAVKSFLYPEERTINGYYLYVVTAVTNKTKMSFTGSINCKNGFPSNVWGDMSGALNSGGIYDIHIMPVSATKFIVNVVSPAWNPDSPIVIMGRAKTDPGPCVFSDSQ